MTRNTIKKMLGTMFSSLSIGMIARFVVSYEEHMVLRLFLSKSLELGLIQQEEVIELIHNRILEIGRNNYNLHIQGLEAPDHVESTESLAYALRFNYFSEEEQSKIKYNYKKDTAEFIKVYHRDNFPQKL